MAEPQPTCPCGNPETWKAIPGYEGHYEASDHGRIRSLDRFVQRSSGAQRKRARIRKISADKVWGYGHISLTIGKKKKIYRAHLVIIETFVGPCPEGMEVRHLDGDPLNNHLMNLKYGTKRENSLDTVRHGTHPWASKTHCPRGHALEGGNLVPSQLQKGKRSCRSCAIARKRINRNPALNLQETSDQIFSELMP